MTIHEKSQVNLAVKTGAKFNQFVTGVSVS